jgi:hypothetical protein
METKHIQDPDEEACTVKVDVSKKRKFYLGGGKPKHFVEASVGKDQDLKMSLVEKETLSEFHSDMMLKVWKRCRQNNIDVVDFMAKTSDGFIIMSNITHDGSQIYGRSLLHTIKSDDHGERKRDVNELDKKFINLMQNNHEKINQAALKIAEKTASAGIILPSDDPLDLILHPDGSWQIMPLDIENAVLDSAPSNEERARDIEVMNKKMWHFS